MAVQKGGNKYNFAKKAWLIWTMDCLILEMRTQENKCCKIEKNMIYIRCFRSVDLYSIIKKDKN